MGLLLCIALKAFIIIIDSIYCYFSFWSNRENLYMIYHDADLYYDISNTEKKHNQRQNHYLSLILISLFDIYKEVIQKAL